MKEAGFLDVKNGKKENQWLNRSDKFNIDEKKGQRKDVTKWPDSEERVVKGHGLKLKNIYKGTEFLRPTVQNIYR